LNFPFSQCFYPQVEVCEQLLKGIASLVNLSALHLELGRGLSVSNLRQVAIALDKLHQLTSLSLGFSGSIFNLKFDEEASQGILHSIANLNKLKALTLGLHDLTMTDQFLTQFAKTLSTQCHKLKSLNLKLSEIQTLSETGLLKLTQATANLQKLSKFSLAILYCPKVNERVILAFLSGVGNLQALTKLAIQVAGYKITDNDLHNLGVAVAKLNSLANLKLSFLNSYAITPQGINQFTLNLSNLRNLTKLTFELSDRNPEVTQVFQAQGRTPIDVAVSKLPYLENLKIRVGE
jgi:hypothetical protein